MDRFPLRKDAVALRLIGADYAWQQSEKLVVDMHGGIPHGRMVVFDKTPDPA